MTARPRARGAPLRTRGLLRLIAGRCGGGGWVAVTNSTAWQADCLTMRFGASGPKLDAHRLGRDCVATLSELGSLADRVARAVNTSLGEMTVEIDTPMAAARLAASRWLLFGEDVAWPPPATRPWTRGRP